MAVDVSGIPNPLQGLCYQPAPTDYVGNQGQGQKYFDTDFCNADFPGFWSQANGGRGDLANMADLGINFLHLYNWNPQRDHVPFLQQCAGLGLFVAVPFSNYFCENIDGPGTVSSICQVMDEIYTHSLARTPVAMWTIANEYNQANSPTPAQIAQVAQVILYYETVKSVSTLLPISSPTSFAPAVNPGIAPTQVLQAAFGKTTAFQATIGCNTVTIPALPSTFFADRYIAATNPQNPGSIPPAASGVTLQSWLPQFASAFPGTPLWFSEIGIGQQNCCTGWPTTCVTSPQQQATFTANQLANAVPGGQNSFLLGSCVFEYTPDYQNPIGSNNYTFSLLSDNNGSSPSVNFTIPSSAPAGGGQTYPVQCLNTSKPVYAAVKNLWKPSGTSPSQWCASGS
ncbi:hypothetical protein [Reyranella sp.]|uniref:hypothetical protein n=1 Tax=Reyranella sp. TaxID=1929291 RepID=UPI003BAC98F4